jgi:hypothetical protein
MIAFTEEGTTSAATEVSKDELQPAFPRDVYRGFCVLGDCSQRQQLKRVLSVHPFPLRDHCRLLFLLRRWKGTGVEKAPGWIGEGREAAENWDRRQVGRHTDVWDPCLLPPRPTSR